MNNKKTWFITGTSQGIGLELVKKALAAGDNVVAATRNIGALQNELKNIDDQLLPVQVNLTDEQSIANGVIAAINNSAG